MKRFIALVSLSFALAIGTTSCAHQQFSKRHAVEVAGTAAVIAGMVLLASQAQCGNCNIGGETPTATALAPR
jgi:hypothetical protein